MAEGLPGCTTKANSPGVEGITDPSGVGLATGVSVTMGVWVGAGVSVAWITSLVGVQEGTKVKRKVIVGVGWAKVGNNVGGGNGFKTLFGSI